MSTAPVRYFSMFVSQSGSAIHGFCQEDVVAKVQGAIRNEENFMLQMKGDRGYSLLNINPAMGSLSLRCNIAQEGDKCWEGVSVDADGNIVADPALAAQQIAPSAATQLHIRFLEPGRARPAIEEKPTKIPDIAE